MVMTGTKIICVRILLSYLTLRLPEIIILQGTN